jgi:hypothetical protein
MGDIARDLLLDLFGRVDEHVHEAVQRLDVATLLEHPEPGTNPIAWLVWHLDRVIDSHIAELDGLPQEWETGDWAASFGLAPDPHNHGYGHTPNDVAAVRPTSADVLLAYHDVASARARAFLQTLQPADFARIVDERWDPPVTMTVRLVSIVDDAIQHAGQAAYARGILERR